MPHPAATMRRAAVLDSHTKPRRPAAATSARPAASAPPAPGAGAKPGAVSFDGVTFRPVAPLSRPGRGAFPGQDESTDAVGYLQCRRAAETGDAAARLWRIHGKLYDLEPFLDEHPGGRVWLELSRGTDATEAFEAHHMDGKKAQLMLKAFYVRDVAPGEFVHGDRFTFEDDGFYRTLRRRVLRRLKEDAGPGATTQDATGPTKAMLAAEVAAVTQFFAAHLLARSTGSRAAAMLAGYFLIGCFGVGHNTMHQSARKGGTWHRALDLVGPPIGPSADFRILHALSHHVFPNLVCDPDKNFPPFKYVDESNSGRAYPLVPLVGPLFVLLRVSLKAVTDAWRRPEAVTYLFPLLHLLSYARGRGSLREGLLLYTLQFGSYLALFFPSALSCHFPVVGFRGEGDDLRAGPAPRDTFAWREGQPGGEADFGRHQVSATSDHAVVPRGVPAFLDHYLSLTLWGYLNDHTLHHLFPAVDHSRFRVVREVFEQTCREFGVDYKQRTTVGLWVGMHRWLMKRVFRAAL